MLKRAEDVLAGRRPEDAETGAAPEPVVPDNEILHQTEDEHERVDPAGLLPDDDASADSGADADADKIDKPAAAPIKGRGRGRGAKAKAAKAKAKPATPARQKRDFSAEVKQKVEDERARFKPVVRGITEELAEPGLGRNLHGGSTSSRMPPSRTGGDKRKAKEEQKPDKEKKRKKYKK